MMEEMKPDIDKMIEAAKKDTSRFKGKMMMIPAPPRKDYSN